MARRLRLLVTSAFAAMALVATCMGGFFGSLFLSEPSELPLNIVSFFFALPLEPAYIMCFALGLSSGSHGVLDPRALSIAVLIWWFIIAAARIWLGDRAPAS